MLTEAIAGYRVLIVEDEYLLSMGLAEMLEAAGAVVVGLVSSVAQAFAMLDMEPEVAILDVQLREETSFPIADELARRGIPFVFATGSVNHLPDAHRARPVCAKPYTQHMILRTLAETREPRA